MNRRGYAVNGIALQQHIAPPCLGDSHLHIADKYHVVSGLLPGGVCRQAG